MPLRMLIAIVLLAHVGMSHAADPWLMIEGGDGPGRGKKVVLISGDEEYRSEEALPQLAKILAKHHGFTCTVLFAIDPKTGNIDPNITNNIPGLDHLKSADLMIIATRFRQLPDDQMERIVSYVESGKPIIGLRTATHAFNIKDGPFAKWTWNGKTSGFEGGFGKQVLGETWVAHHGNHGKEGTRGIVAPGKESHPITKGIEPKSIFGTTDVYTVTVPLPDDCQPIYLGEVTQTLEADSAAVLGKKNNPMMPIAWTKTYQKARVFTTTMGAAEDFAYEGTRRMLVNACYWSLGMENQLADRAQVDLVGTYSPSKYKFNGAKKGLKPEDYR